MFTSEILLPSGNRIELAGCANDSGPCRHGMHASKILANNEMQTLVQGG